MVTMTDKPKELLIKYKEGTISQEECIELLSYFIHTFNEVEDMLKRSI